MPRVIERVRAAASVTGTLRAAAIAPWWLVSRRFKVLTGAIGELPASSPGKDLEWEQLTLQNAAEVEAINPLIEPGEFAGRLNRGMTCFAVRQSGRAVHYRWYATAPTWLPFLRLRWIPAPGEYTVLDVFTEVSARGAGLHSAISAQALERARGLGLRRCVSFIAWWNEPSLRVALKIGFQRAGSVTLWRLGVMTRHTASGLVRIKGDELTVLSR